MVKIVKCTCSNDYQDKQYGQGNRVANMTVKGKARCSVCNKEH